MIRFNGLQPFSIFKRAVRRLTLVGMALTPLACASSTDGSESAFAGMDHPVDLSRYAGTWYELARTPNRYQDNRPQRNGKRYSVCARTTATYRLESQTTLSIRNVCRRSAQDGSTYEDVAQGVARVVPDTNRRKLKVAFGPAIARFFQWLFTWGRSNYWIIDLGGTHGEQPYTWAVVSGPDLDFIYFLTRTRFPGADIKDAMLTSARRAGLPVEELNFSQE